MSSKGSISDGQEEPLESDVKELKIRFLKPPRLRPLLFLWFCSMPEECRRLGTFNCWKFLGYHFFQAMKVGTTNNQMMSLWPTISDNDSYKKGKDTMIKIPLMSQSKSDIDQHLLVAWLWCFHSERFSSVHTIAFSCFQQILCIQNYCSPEVEETHFTKCKSSQYKECKLVCP